MEPGTCYVEQVGASNGLGLHIQQSEYSVCIIRQIPGLVQSLAQYRFSCLIIRLDSGVQSGVEYNTVQLIILTFRFRGLVRSRNSGVSPEREIFQKKIQIPNFKFRNFRKLKFRTRNQFGCVLCTLTFLFLILAKPALGVSLIYKQ